MEKLRKDTPNCIIVDFKNLQFKIDGIEKFRVIGYKETQSWRLCDFQQFTSNERLGEFKERQREILDSYGI